MTSQINAIAAAEHQAELRRAAGRRRNLQGGPDQADVRTIELRFAYPDDEAIVHRLAALDDAPELPGRILLALIDGQAVAALSLEDRRVVANPFLATSKAVELLRLRAEHLAPARGRRRLRGILRPRFA
jgi:hypothetical protein